LWFHQNQGMIHHLIKSYRSRAFM